MPNGVTSLNVTAVGAPGSVGSDTSFGGNGSAGGKGAVVTAPVSVTPGENLFVEVGGVGKKDGSAAFNGGGRGSLGSGGGGGATDVRTASRNGDAAASRASRILVAGGGGGGANISGNLGTPGTGGAAGTAGGDGNSGVGDPAGGLGGSPGTAGAPGAGGGGGAGSCCGGNGGGAGVLSAGGDADGNISGAGGGGGGGRFGGGAGGTGGRSGGGQNAPGGGGGGGSNLVPGGGSATADTVGVPTVTFAFDVEPTVALGPAVVLGPDRALLLGSTSEDQGSISGVFEYGLDTNYVTQVATTNASLEGGTVSALLTGLTPGTTYHYRLVGTTGLGHVAQSPDATFTTLAAGAGTGPQGPPGTNGTNGTNGKDAAAPRLTASVAAARARRGVKVTLHVSVHNGGTGAASNVQVALLPSRSLRPLSAKSPFAIVRVGTVAAGATRTVSVHMKVSRTAKRGKLSVAALVIGGAGLTSQATGRLTIR